MIEKIENNEFPICFGPITGKHLKKMYPELNGEPVFADLTNDEMLFAWYLGSQSSPVDHNWTEEIRYKQSASRSFPNNKEKRDQYSAKDIPERVMLAVEKMGNYSPNARMLSAISTQNNFYNILKMSQADIDKDFNYTDKDGNSMIDWTARKQYMDTIKTSAEILPILIKQIEEGFGIAKTKKEQSTTKAIDKFHTQKKDNQ